jgi:hypothetical protein
MVNIHSKCIVLDPFGANPVVMTGSHNLGFKASSENDDNLVIIEGNAPLAAAYAVNIIAIFHTYRWNSYVNAHRQDPNVWHGPKDSDQWQASYLRGSQLADLQFWFGDQPAAVPAKAMAAAAGTAATGTAAPAATSAPVAQPVPARRAVHSVSTGGHHKRHVGPAAAPAAADKKPPLPAKAPAPKSPNAAQGSRNKPQPQKQKKKR